jgi:excisionase family DNA binding protein
MDNSVNSLRVPGYVSVKEAAEMLGLSPRTVYDYIEEGRLPSARLADVIAIPIEEIKKFKREPSGRPRQNTPLWHISWATTRSSSLSFRCSCVRVNAMYCSKDLLSA